jgi:hypothetical protein
VSSTGDPIAAMKCEEGVPDDVYLSASINARTPEEIAFRDLLLFHRDVLNGGLDQALENLHDDPAQLSAVLCAYKLLGLERLASVIQDAGSEISAQRDIGHLDDRYAEQTQGSAGSEIDLVEAQAIRFAQSRHDAFSNVAAGAPTASKDSGSDDLLRRIEERVEEALRNFKDES